MEGPDALMRLREGQKAAARAGRRAKAASTCPLAGTVKGLCRRGGRAAPSWVPVVTVTGWWGLLWELAEDRPSPAGGAASGRFRRVLRTRYAG